MAFQTNENDPANRYDEDDFEPEPEISSLWLGRRDSNPRMTAPKTVALPLGHAPLFYHSNNKF